MIRVTFEHSDGVEETIAELDTDDDAFRFIADFMDLHDYTSPYIRVDQMGKNHRVIDVGSYSEFFHFYKE